jgi:putative restriction endonuclease
MAKNNWTREEHILAYNLYCKIPFTKINSKNPLVKELAKMLGRSEGSVAMKLANFARLDPVLKARNISGLTQGAKGEIEIWGEFNNNWDELAYQSELLLAKYKGESIEKIADIETSDLYTEGIDRESIIKTRVNQYFFRKTVLASYNNICCITGISTPALLVAGHIIPWAKNREHRMNPKNGLCLNTLHDKAFDLGLLTITPNYILKLSDTLLQSIKNPEADLFFIPYQNKAIILPERFTPAKAFLEYHNYTIFKG